MRVTCDGVCKFCGEHSSSSTQREASSSSKGPQQGRARSVGGHEGLQLLQVALLLILQQITGTVDFVQDDNM